MSAGAGRDGAGPADRAVRDPRGSDRPERIVLVGFMASGKSTVGRILASHLGVEFVDLDDEAEARAGRSIPEIFAADGEAAFRALEVEVTEATDAVRPAVVATGGGWMARPELRDRWPDAVRVWLRVSPPAVLARLGGELESRPMLDPSHPERSIGRIMDSRLGDYARAEVAVDTDGRSAAEVAERVLELLELR